MGLCTLLPRVRVTAAFDFVRRLSFRDLFQRLMLHIIGRGTNQLHMKKSWRSAELNPRQMKSNIMKQVFIL